MDNIAWILVAIGAVVGIVLAILVLRAPRLRLEPAPDTDYRTFFLVGVIMLVLGIGLGIALLTVLEASWVIAMPLTSIGVVFIAIGAGNRDKWSHR